MPRRTTRFGGGCTVTENPAKRTCQRCGVHQEDVFVLRHDRTLCVVCMGLPEEYDRFVAGFDWRAAQ
jgi:hypothetical protein